MPEGNSYPTLRERTTTLLINLAIVYAAYIAATQRWLPSGGLESVWLLSAFALWFFSLLSAPWFIPPRDALANAIAAGAVLVTIDLSPAPEFQSELEIIRWIAVTYCAAVIILSLVSLFLHDRDQRAGNGRFAFRLTGIFGRGEILYKPPAIISILGAYQASFTTIAWLVLLWVLLIVTRPVEHIASARRQ